MRGKIQLSYIIGISLLLVTGCTTFPQNNLPEVDRLTPLTQKTRNVNASYTFVSGISQNGRNASKLKPHSEEKRHQYEQEFLDTLVASGYFTSVNTKGDGDVKIDLRFATGKPTSWLVPTISAVTLTIIPTWTEERYAITARVTAANGETHTYELDDSFTTVYWLPMVFAAPFGEDPETLSLEMRANIWHNLIIKMRQDNILREPQ